MSHSRLAEIAHRFVIEPEVAPAAVVAVAWQGSRGCELEEGSAFAKGARYSGVGSSALFDLASVTKPFTALTVARLVQRGRVGFDTPLGELLAEARGTATGNASLLLLLSHRAGLQAHRTLFAPLLAGLPFERAAAIAEIVHGRRPECVGETPTDGHPPLYSDLGYALIGLAIERLEGLPFDQVVAREVCTPLDLEVGSSRLLRSRFSDFAERSMPTETVPFRNGEVRGVVHDENAWALSGHAASGHAGLFGTARSVTRFGAALLDVFHGRCQGWLETPCLLPLLETRPGGTLRAGFDGKSADQSSVGSLAGPRSFGHLGFTGTSLWCDPDADRVLVLLTNRVCPTRNNPRIRAARPVVNDALFGFRP